MIRSVSKPNCYLYGRPGEDLYNNLTDRLCGVEGSWALKKCPHDECGLLWLDPMPCADQIDQLYPNYYTPKKLDLAERRIFPKRIVENAKGRLKLLFPSYRHIAYMYLDTVKPGHLLEVGCGDGSRLLMFKKRGWLVEGQEVNPIAASNASTTCDSRIHVGELPCLALPGESFDAIVMNHVIEHVPDAIQLVQECGRLLKKGGRLVAVTPNSRAFGHSYFGSHWRGLEPPRHVFVFNENTLRTLVCHGNFRAVKSWTTAVNAVAFVYPSLAMSRKKRQPHRVRKTKAQIIKVYELLLETIGRPAGEECVVVAEK